MTTLSTSVKDLNVLSEGILYHVRGNQLGGCSSEEIEYKFCMYVGQEVLGKFNTPWRVFGWATSQELFRVKVPEGGYEVLGDGEFVKSSQGVYAVPIRPGIEHKPKVKAFLEKWEKLTEKRFLEDVRFESYYSEVVRTLDELDDVDSEIERLTRRRDDLRRVRNDYDRGFRIETSVGLMKRGLEEVE